MFFLPRVFVVTSYRERYVEEELKKKRGDAAGGQAQDAGAGRKPVVFEIRQRGGLRRG